VNNLSQIIYQYKTDNESVNNTWFVDNDQRLRTFRTVYSCSIHPEITNEKQEECPKCGMSLIEKKMDMKKEDTPQKHKH
jgi:uncharacterized protein with PIN domain